MEQEDEPKAGKIEVFFEILSNDDEDVNQTCDRSQSGNESQMNEGMEWLQIGDASDGRWSRRNSAPSNALQKVVETGKKLMGDRFRGHSGSPMRSKVHPLLDDSESAPSLTRSPFMDMKRPVRIRPWNPNELIFDGETMYPNMRHGLALIINIEHYKHMDKRTGSEFDANNMQKILEAIGYVCFRYDDLVKKDLEFQLTQFASNPLHKKRDSAIVVIMSHGEDGAIIPHDGLPQRPETHVSLEEVFTMFNAKNAEFLRGKPKFFIIQACRGGDRDFGYSLKMIKGRPRSKDAVDSGDNEEHTSGCFPCFVDEDDEEMADRIPISKDFIVAYCTSKNYVAFRCQDGSGSPFIQALYSVFEENADKMDILTMLTKVNAKVTVTAYGVDKKKYQCPEIVFRLTKLLFFFPKNRPQSGKCALA